MESIERRSRAAQQSGQASLIGLLVVMLIIGVLAGTIYPQIAGRNEYSASGEVKGPATPIDRAYDTACTVYMEQVSQAAFMYRQDHDAPPPDLESLKPYGVDNAIINTPNCNFGLPKQAVQPSQDGSSGWQQPAGNQSQQSGAYAPGAQSQYPQQPVGANPNPGYEVVGGVKVPTSSDSEGYGGALGQ